MDARIRTMIEQQLEAPNQRMAEMKTKLDELTKKRNSEVNEKISSNVDRNSFKLLPKPEFPSFDGSNPRNWVKKCSRYFALCNIPDSQRVDVASIHLTGKAETWFAHYSAVRKNMDWCDFILDVCTCFKEDLGVTRQPNSGSGTPPSVDAPQLLDESPKSNPDVSSHGWVGEGQGQSPNAIGERLEGLNPSNGLVEKSLSSICDKDLDLCEQEVSKDDCCDEHHPLADAFQVFDEMPSAAEAGVPPRDYYQQPPAHDVAHEGSVILANPSEKELGTVSKQCWPFQELELRGCKGGYVGIKVIEQCYEMLLTLSAPRMEGGCASPLVCAQTCCLPVFDPGILKAGQSLPQLRPVDLRLAWLAVTMVAAIVMFDPGGTNLSAGEEHKGVVAEAGGVKAVVDLTFQWSTGDDGVLERAVGALASRAAADKCSLEVALAGSVHALLMLAWNCKCEGVQEKKLLVLPKLLDICPVYGHENEDLTRVLVLNAINALGSVAEQVPSQELELSGCAGSYVGMVIRQHCEVWQVMTPHAHRVEGGWPAARFYCSKRKTLKPLSYESHGWKWVKSFSFMVFDPGKLRSPLYGRAEASPSQRRKLLQVLSADIAREIDDRATDIILNRGEDAITAAWHGSGSQLCFYDVLSSHFVQVLEDGQPILDLIENLWSQSFASRILALLFHKWLFKVKVEESAKLLRYSSALVQGSTNVCLDSEKPVHQVLGGGKPADVLLWRNKMSASVFQRFVAAVNCGQSTEDTAWHAARGRRLGTKGHRSCRIGCLMLRNWRRSFLLCPSGLHKHSGLSAELKHTLAVLEFLGSVYLFLISLGAHTGKSGVALVAREKCAEPNRIVITPVKKELGLAFKGSQKMVVEALEAMDEKEAMEMRANLESKGEVEFYFCTLVKNVTIINKLVTIMKEKKREHQRVFARSDELGVPSLKHLPKRGGCFLYGGRKPDTGIRLG